MERTGSAGERSPVLGRPKAEFTLLVVIIAIALAIVVAGILFYRSQSANVTAQANGLLSSIVDLKVRDLVTWRAERIGDALMLTQNSALTTLVAGAIDHPRRAPAPELLSWMRRVRQGHEYDRVVVLDATGRAVLSVPQTDTPPANRVVSEVPYVLSTGQASFVDFYRNEFDGRIYVGVMAPVIDTTTHRRLGAVYLGVDPETRLYPYIQTWSVESASGETLLVRRDVDAALFLNPLRFNPTAALSIRTPLDAARPTPAAKAVSGFEGTYRGPDYRGVDVFSAVRHVPGSDWYLVAKMDASEALAPLNARFWQVLLLMVAALLAAVVGIAFAQRLRGARHDRERLESALERSWLLHVLASTSNEIYVFDALTLRFTFVNDSALTNLGYNAAEMEQMTPADIQPGFTEQILDALPARDGSGMEPGLAIERIHRRKDGSEYPVTIEYRRTYTGTRDVFLSVAEDITVRKLAEDGLRNSEERYRNLVEQASDGILLADAGGTYVDVNAAAAAMLGYSREELLGKSLADFVDPDDETATPLRPEELQAGETVISRRLLIRKDGSRVPVELSGRMTADGHMQAIVRDVSERAEAESRLLESEALLIQSQRAAAVGHYVLDIGAGVWTSSEVLDELFGIGPEYDRSVDGWIGIVHPDDQQAMTEYLHGHVLRDHLSFDREYRIVRKNDNAVRWVRGLGELESDSTGTLTRMFGVIQDITERKLAEIEVLSVHAGLEQSVADRTAQLESANRELEAFSYSVSHDLRAPLRHVSGFVELLEEKERERLDEKGLHYLDVISDSVNQMGTLIDDLLQFSRVGRAELSMGDVDMNAVVQEALPPLMEAARDRDIEWDIANLPIVRGDHPTLRLVWANLLGNAIKYSRDRKPAHIRIGATEEDDRVVFFVQDDGVGFDMAYAGKLFGVFQRMHSESEFEGTGIGLANVNRVITRHGGKAWAEAELGKGATFYFSIPRRKG